MNLGKHAAAGLALLCAGAVAATVAADVGRRTTLALTYREGDGTRVDMFAVQSPSNELGHADVKRDDGRTRVKLSMDEELPHPQSLGALYTTYVLWAVAPEGRAENLAELPPDKDFSVEATTSLPTFGLIVTAEPHAVVSRPGPRLVAENRLRGDTKARVQTGTVAYDAAPERQGLTLGAPDFKTARPLLGARRAVEIARAAGATTYADAELRQAEVKLAALDERWSGHDKLSKDAETTARDVMRLAEQARSLSADRLAQAELSAERRAARTAVNQAQTEAALARSSADRERERAARANEQAALASQEATLANQEAARAGDQAARAAEEAARSRERVAEARDEAERARAEAERARRDAQAAMRDKAEMQEDLYRSLSAVLETRREARGLIVNLSDVLFDFNKASLKPGAREKLSKLSGILLAYPGPFRIEIEGHTDAVGSDTYNLDLSRDRANSVRTYVVMAGIPADRITHVSGLGESRPVATNDTASGRQMNRRVELVITDMDRPS